MNVDTLVALVGASEIGHIRRDRRGRLTFTYEAAWRAFRGAFPLSLSMPLAASEHGHSAIEPFLWNLLPDNELILDRWARRFQVSARNAFALVAHVGEDCAGAFQFVRQDRRDAILAQEAPEIEWLEERDVALRLRALRTDQAAWRSPADSGQFSLAGAQPKTALLYQDGRWGVPSGRTPTTHILKPPTHELDGHAENEHLCLALARALGLPAASSEVRRFENEVAIVVERYDRASTATLAAAAAAEAAARAAEAAGWAARTDDAEAAAKASRAAAQSAAAAARAQSLHELAKSQPILRLHQEDICQALGLPPTAKYQNEGGPSPPQIVDLLRAHSSRPTDDVSTFIDALAVHWVIAGTDAHAKNYSLLHGGQARVRLAPLYDVASALPYPHLDQQALRLAMAIGGTYRLRDVGPRQWRKLATELRLDPEEMVERVAQLAAALPDHAAAQRSGRAGEALRHPLLDRLTDALADRARQCQKALTISGTH
jgi:serine/threonine-protein kinase HipA